MVARDIQRIREALSSVALTLLFVVVFQTTAYATYYIPSESMVPTLQVGDRLSAAKFAYGYGRFSPPFDFSLPPSVTGRLLANSPKRGDIVVFMHPHSGERMVKRVIGLPGDTIEMRRGRLIINGVEVERRYIRTYSYRENRGRVVEVEEYTERLPDGPEHFIIERTDGLGVRDMGKVTIPAERYFMMGDNRDNSADSRFAEMGLVPFDNLVGRADAILFTLYSCREEKGLECAPRRFASILR
jgi:signal peptidase I